MVWLATPPMLSRVTICRIPTGSWLSEWSGFAGDVAVISGGVYVPGPAVQDLAARFDGRVALHRQPHGSPPRLFLGTCGSGPLAQQFVAQSRCHGHMVEKHFAKHAAADRSTAGQAANATHVTSEKAIPAAPVRAYFLEVQYLLAITVQDFGKVRVSAVAIGAKQQILVFRFGFVSVPAKPRKLPQPGRVKHSKTERWGPADTGMHLRPASFPKADTAFAEDRHGCPHEIDFRVLFHEAHLRRDSLRITNVISVHSRKVDAASSVDAFVKPRPQSLKEAIRPDHDSRISRSAGDVSAFIRRTIVTEEKFPVLKGLELDRSNGFSQRSLTVPKRHCDAYQRLPHSTSLWSLTGPAADANFPKKLCEPMFPEMLGERPIAVGASNARPFGLIPQVKTGLFRTVFQVMKGDKFTIPVVVAL